AATSLERDLGRFYTLSNRDLEIARRRLTSFRCKTRAVSQFWSRRHSGAVVHRDVVYEAVSWWTE
ncbi:MAG: hypothetical protein J2P17_30920, partial [Mycobacterium sp.]|nr:hypothetical protein [Mycobacterium sp.]